jgi:hypothetical protein
MTANGGGKFVVFETNGNVGTLRIGGLFVGSWYFPGKAQKNLVQCISTAHQAALDAVWDKAIEAAIRVAFSFGSKKMVDRTPQEMTATGLCDAIESKIRALKRSK